MRQVHMGGRRGRILAHCIAAQHVGHLKPGALNGLKCKNLAALTLDFVNACLGWYEGC